MSVNIDIPADKVWSFFQDNKERLSEEMVAIAENNETEYVVYLTEENRLPLFIVCNGRYDNEFSEGAVNESDCTETAKRCYARFLFPVTVSNKNAIPHSQFDEADEDEEYEEVLTEQEMEDAIYEREDELQLAMSDFLQVVLREGRDGTDIVGTYGESMVNEILDHVLEFLSDEMCLPIYRPTFLTDDDTGEEVYTEYPYDPYDMYDDDETYVSGLM